jgi:hypothetical protein
MTISLRVPAVDEEALRHDQMQVVLCAGHGWSEGMQPSDDIEQIDRLPLLALRGVDCGLR